MKPDLSVTQTHTLSLSFTHHGRRDGGWRQRPLAAAVDLGPLLFVVGDVDGHGVVAEAPHLVRREVLVRRLAQQVLLACNNRNDIDNLDRKMVQIVKQTDSRNNVQTSTSMTPFMEKNLNFEGKIGTRTSRTKRSDNVCIPSLGVACVLCSVYECVCVCKCKRTQESSLLASFEFWRVRRRTSFHLNASSG